MTTRPLRLARLLTFVVVFAATTAGLHAFAGDRWGAHHHGSSHFDHCEPTGRGPTVGQ